VINDDLWTDYINCDDTSGGDGGGQGVCNRASTLFVLLAMCYGTLLFLGACLLTNPPKDYVPPRANNAIIKDDDVDIKDIMEEAPPPPPPPNDYDAMVAPTTSLSRQESEKQVYEVTKRLMSYSGIGSSGGGGNADYKTLSTDDYIHELEKASNPQTMKELISLHITKVCMVSFIFMGTPGVFIAGSYKAIGLQFFDNDRSCVLFDDVVCCSWCSWCC
jgi:hypothetical protein